MFLRKEIKSLGRERLFDFLVRSSAKEYFLEFLVIEIV